MKNILTLLLLVFAFGVSAQNYAPKSDLVIIDKSGQSFYLIINGVAQNPIPQTQLKMVGMPAAYYELKLLYTNGVAVNLQEFVTLQPFKQHTAFVAWRKGQKRFEWIEVTGVHQSNYGRNMQVTMYTPAYTETCYLCTRPSSPGYHYHPDGTIHNNCCGTGANTPNGQYPPNGNYPPNGHYPPNGNQNPHGNNYPNNLNCQYVLPTIEPILEEIDNIPFSARKMEYAMDALANKCIDSDQAHQIVAAFTYDNDRVKIAKYCFDRMTDPVYANKLLDLFPYSSTRNEVRKYFTR